MLKISYILTATVFCFFLYGLGFISGITYEGHVSQWSKNFDLSDIISLAIIAALSIALLLSLLAHRKTDR